MQWTADNTPSTIQSKSLKLRELFAKVANASLDKGFSKEESIFAGTNAVKIEERKNQPAKVKAPKLPSHVEALRSYTNPFEVVSKAEEIIEVQSTVKSAEFDADGHLILSMSDGKKIKTKNKAAEQNIEQNIAIAPNVQLFSSNDSVNITQDGQAFDLTTVGSNVDVISSDGTITVSQTGDVFDLSASSGSGTVNLTSLDGSIVITENTGSYDLAVSAASPASTLVVQVRNQTGSTLTKGTVVYINGASGNKPLVSKALATSDATSAQTLGLITADINTNQNGYVTIIGVVAGLNTSAFAEGVQLYLSPTVAGTYTATKPHAPSHLVYVGVVTRSHQNQGSIEVKVQNGYELDEIHDVQIVNPTDGQIIAYDSDTQLWKNIDAPANSVTSVTATAPINSTGGLTPIISITEATTTSSGSMSAGDKLKLDGISVGAQVNSITSVAGKTGDVTLDKSDVGLSNVDNTADSAKSVASASTLTTARLINGVSFNGSADITIADSTKQPLDSDLTAIAALTGTSGLLKKTATNTWTLDTNNYVTSSGVTSVNATGTVSGLTFSGTVTSTGDLTLSGQLEVLPSDFQSQAANLVLASPNSTTGKPTFRALVTSDIPNLDASKITSGTIDAARLPSYIDDVLEFSNLASFPSTGETGKLYVALDTNKVYRWSGSTYIFITSGAVDSVAGKTGVVTLNSSDVGLSNVENKSSSTIRSEITSTNVTTALGFTPYNATNPNGYITTDSNITGTASNVTGTISTSNGGTGLTSYTAGDILYASDSNTLTKLPIGSVGDVLQVDSDGKPSWLASSSGSTLTVADSAPSDPSSGDEWLNTTDGIKYTYVSDGTSDQWVELESLLSINNNVSIYSNEYVLTGTTNDDVEKEIFVNGIADNRIGIATNTFIYYTLDIACKSTDSSTDFAAFYVKGAATNNADVVSDAGSLYEIVVTRSNPNILIDVRVNSTTKTLNVYVTGLPGKTFSWKTALKIVEV